MGRSDLAVRAKGHRPTSSRLETCICFSLFGYEHCLVSGGQPRSGIPYQTRTGLMMKVERGEFFDFEVTCHDGAYTGRLHVQMHVQMYHMQPTRVGPIMASHLKIKKFPSLHLHHQSRPSLVWNSTPRLPSAYQTMLIAKEAKTDTCLQTAGGWTVTLIGGGGRGVQGGAPPPCRNIPNPQGTEKLLEDEQLST